MKASRRFGSWQHQIVRLVLLAIALFNFGCANIAEMAQGFLYPVESANETEVPNYPPMGYGQDLLDVDHANGRLKIHLWFRRHPTSSDAPVVIHFHGNGENIGSLAKGGFFQKMESLGAHFVVMDYPGYGKSSGHPEQSTLMAAAQAKIEWTKKMFPRSRVIVWGWSLGSAVAFQAAAKNTDIVDAVVTDSPWTNIRSLAKEKFGSLADQIPEELYLKNEWNSLKAAGRIKAPLLIRHGEKDSVIPFSHGQIVSEAADPTRVRFKGVPEKGHGDIFVDSNYWSDLTKLVQTQRL